MDDGDDSRTTGTLLSINSSNSNNGHTGRDRSTSEPSAGHRRSLSGSVFSRLSFLRVSHATQITSARNLDDANLPSSLSTGRAMSSALQQQRRTRRRRGSLRKTALLGTRLEKKSARAVTGQQRMSPLVAQENDSATPRGNYDSRLGGGGGGGGGGDETEWTFTTAQKQPLEPRPTSAVRYGNNLLDGGDISTDDDQGEMPYSTLNTTNADNTTNHSNDNSNNNNNNASSNESNDPLIHPSSRSSTSANAGLAHLPTPSSSTDSYFTLPQPDPTYRSVHHPKSPLATHASEMKPPQEITWDYAETEWWGWIILVVTWLVFVVGMGSCFEVWSWAWDVGETPYAPPELEDDPTLPIVGYYPALIILTAVMSWVWVVIAWVGMKYFKHANISGEDI